MSQSQFKKTITAAALSGLMLGTTGLVTGCAHEDQPGVKAATPAGAQHACKGLNACKGQGGCKTAANACKGMNACKGQGGCKAN
jgi:hypothetical protein